MSNEDVRSFLGSAEYQQELGAQRTFMARVYGWMTIGLMTTALVSLAMNIVFGANILALGAGPFYLLIFLQLGIAVAMGFAIHKMPAALAGLLFLVYSGITGLVFSILFLIYTKGSIAGTFFVTAGTFAGMSVWGYTTRRDLTTMGSYVIMALWGLIIATVVNFFIASSGLYWLCTYAGVIIFTLLTAYDTQKIKQAYAVGEYGSRAFETTAIYGAFSLYLDFINLFIYLLRIMGSRRD